jgi:hypothetical protein
VNTENHSQTAAFLWPIADLLRRIECVLETIKGAVIRESYAQEGQPDLVASQLYLVEPSSFSISPFTDHMPLMFGILKNGIFQPNQ